MVFTDDFELADDEYFAAWHEAEQANAPLTWATDDIDARAAHLTAWDPSGRRKAQRATFERTVLASLRQRARTADAAVWQYEDDDRVGAANYSADCELAAMQREVRLLQRVLAAAMCASLREQDDDVVADNIEALDLEGADRRTAPPPPASSFTRAIVMSPIVPAAPPRPGALV